MMPAAETRQPRLPHMSGADMARQEWREALESFDKAMERFADALERHVEALHHHHEITARIITEKGDPK